MAASKTTSKPTVFTCKAPDAQAVFLAGTFNDWNPEATPLKRLKSGEWRTSLKLAPGRYEYRFLIDGDWCCAPGCEEDHSCPNCVVNEFGGMNRVIEVA